MSTSTFTNPFSALATVPSTVATMVDTLDSKTADAQVKPAKKPPVRKNSPVTRPAGTIISYFDRQVKEALISYALLSTVMVQPPRVVIESPRVKPVELIKGLMERPEFKPYEPKLKEIKGILENEKLDPTQRKEQLESKMKDLEKDMKPEEKAALREMLIRSGLLLASQKGARVELPNFSDIAAKLADPPEGFNPAKAFELAAEKPPVAETPKPTTPDTRPAINADSLDFTTVKPELPKTETPKTEARTQPENTVRLEETTKTSDTPNEKLVKLCDELYPELKEMLPGEKAKLETLFDGLGEIQGRAKNPISGANRLQRAIENGWAKDGIKTVADVRQNLWDAIGTRLVVEKPTAANMEVVTQRIIKGIENGTLKPKSINNLRGPNGKAYFTAEQLQRIKDAGAAKGLEIKVGDYEAKPDKSPFTSACMYVDLGKGITGEFQIIGPEALKIANAEHLPYDVTLGKDLYRELSPEGKAKLQPEMKPFEDAMRNLNKDQQQAFNEYLNKWFIHARNLEMGVKSTPPELPSGMDPALKMENVLQLEGRYQAIKKQFPAAGK